MNIRMLYHLILLVISVCESVRAEMEGFVVGGEFASISKYPHSAFLAISCASNNQVSNWVCGSSILNQHFTLTAGHCLEGCSKYSRVDVIVGNENREKGTQVSVRKYKVHENYDSLTMENDIAIVRLKTPLKLNSRVQRVSILKNPPYNGETGYVAGWGVTDEIRGIGTKRLKHVKQALWSHNACTKVLGNVPQGSICAGSKNTQADFAAEGDSGSALIVRGYIQIGIVSYKMPKLTKSLSVYTEVKYFYDWINLNTKKMFCS